MHDELRPCPHCHEPIRAEAVKCRHCRRGLDRATLSIDWTRDADDRQLAGVSAMLGRAAGISPTVVRLGFVALTVFAGGLGLWLYALVWLCTGTAGRPSPVAKVMDRAEEVLFPDAAHEPSPERTARETRTWPSGGPVAAGPMPPEPYYKSRYDADDDEWKKRF